jgi:hypothetical protein
MQVFITKLSFKLNIQRTEIQARYTEFIFKIDELARMCFIESIILGKVIELALYILF